MAETKHTGKDKASLRSVRGGGADASRGSHRRKETDLALAVVANGRKLPVTVGHFQRGEWLKQFAQLDRKRSEGTDLAFGIKPWLMRWAVHGGGFRMRSAQ